MPDIQSDFELTINDRVLTDDEKALISELEFSESMESGTASAVTFTMRDSEREDIETLDFRVESSVLLRIGYVNNLRAVFVGVIVSIRPVCDSNGFPRIEIVCHDLSYLLKKAGLQREEITGKTWRSIVNQIEGRFNLLSFNIMPPDKLDIRLEDDQSVTYGGMERKERTLYTTQAGTMVENRPEQGDTPWEVLLSIADRHSMRLLVRGQVLFMAEKGHSLLGQTRRFKMVYNPGPDDTDNSVIPLIDFNAETDLANNNNNTRCVEFRPSGDTKAKTEDKTTTKDEEGKIVSDWPRNDAKLIQAPRIVGASGKVQDRKDWIDKSALPLRIDELPRFPKDEKTYMELMDYAGEPSDLFQPEKSITQKSWKRRFYSIFGDLFLDKLVSNILWKPKDVSESERVPLTSNEPELIVTEGGRTQRQAEESAKARQQNSYERLTTGSGRIPGCPDIRAGHLHDIVLNALGVIGKDYSGEYFFTSVTHTMSTDGYFTSFKVSRPHFRTPVAKGDIKL